MAASDQLRQGFTELDAARLYVRLVSDRDPEPFLARLSPEVRYLSQWVLADLCGAAEVARILRSKVRAVTKKGPPFPQARLGVSMRTPGRPLAILMNAENGEAEGTVTFDVSAGHIVAVSICVLGWEKPALLEHPDDYVWSEQEAPTAIRTTPATFAEEGDLLADSSDGSSAGGRLILDDNERRTGAPPQFEPISDAVIAEARQRSFGGTTVTLLPPDDARLAACDFPGLEDARAAARSGAILLLLLTRDEVAIGVVTCPRSRVPWSIVDISGLCWLMRDGELPQRYFDFDAWNELILFGMLPLIRASARSIA